MKLKTNTSLFTIALLVFCNCNQSSASELTKIIQEFESKNDPKCYSTANRVENMVHGFPLSDEARQVKNKFTKTPHIKNLEQSLSF